MKQYINENTIANTVRMGALSRRPKLIYLASSQADVELVQALPIGKHFRVIPAHSRENAIGAFGILVQANWEGISPTVNSRFNSLSLQDALGEAAWETKDGVGIEEIWEELLGRGSLLTGRNVRVTRIDGKFQLNEAADRSNEDMLAALREIEVLRKEMNPKNDGKDYLREAREGAAYGVNGD